MKPGETVVIQSLIVSDRVVKRLSSYRASEVKKGLNLKMNPASAFERKRNNDKKRKTDSLCLMRPFDNCRAAVIRVFLRYNNTISRLERNI